MRLFFAIALPASARDGVAGVADGVERQLAGHRATRSVKWVERQNLHVTLRFIGEVDDRRAATLLDAMRQPLGVAAYRATLGGGGCFPRTGPPRVAWIGMGDGADDTRRVFEALDERLVPLGFEKEPRPYTPHLTLGRVREIDRQGGTVLRDALAAVPAVLATIEVAAITLYRSHLSSSGPRYDILLETPLS